MVSPFLYLLMQERDILKKAAETVTDEAITFEVDISPRNWFHAWQQRVGWKPKKATYKIRPLYMGTLKRISYILLKFKVGDFHPEKILAHFRDNLGDMAQIIALAITNSEALPAKSLTNLILWNFTRAELALVLKIVLHHMDVRGFMMCIVSARHLNIMETNPQETGEKIAPGTTSEAS